TPWSPASCLGGTALRLVRDDRWRLGPLEGGGKQVAGGKAAVGAPFLGDGEDLLLGGEGVGGGTAGGGPLFLGGGGALLGGGGVVELVGDLDGLTEGKVARQDD